MVKYYDIPTYENYQISKCGSVRRKDTKIIKSVYIGNGYPTLSINKKTEYVHRLLCLTFIPNTYNKPLVDHIDRNRSNNNLSNLRWATWEENMNNKINSDCNLTPEQIKEKIIIKKKYMKNYNRVYRDMLQILKDDLI
jgi:hypothetical protein